MLAVVCYLREEVRLERPPLSRVRRTIDQPTDDEAWVNFRFRKGDLPTLLTVFAFPEDILRVAVPGSSERNSFSSFCVARGNKRSTTWVLGVSHRIYPLRAK